MANFIGWPKPFLQPKGLIISIQRKYLQCDIYNNSKWLFAIIPMGIFWLKFTVCRFGLFCVGIGNQIPTCAHLPKSIKAWRLLVKVQGHTHNSSEVTLSQLIFRMRLLPQIQNQNDKIASIGLYTSFVYTYIYSCLCKLCHHCACVWQNHKMHA